MNEEPKTCGICKRAFVADKYHPHQIYCGSSECQKERRRRYLAQYNKSWQKRHKDYWKEYHKLS